MLRCCEIGEAVDLHLQEKKVLLLGSTGSVKTTLINGIANYLYGINWEDSFCFKAINEDDELTKNPNRQAFSVTKYITSYRFNYQEGFKVPLTLTLIDTPSFGNSSIYQSDEKIKAQLNCFLSEQFHFGIKRIDLIGFVIQSSNVKMNHFHYSFPCLIKEIFGENFVDDICVFTTFSDAGRPQVLYSLKASHFPFKNFFQVNNSSLFVKNQETEEKMKCQLKMNKDFWNFEMKAFQTFFDWFLKINVKIPECKNKKKNLKQLKKLKHKLNC
jgi:hypothetical protein